MSKPHEVVSSFDKKIIETLLRKNYPDCQQIEIDDMTDERGEIAARATCSTEVVLGIIQVGISA